MHKTEAGEKSKALRAEAREIAGKAKTLRAAAGLVPIIRIKAQKYQAAADKAHARARALKGAARLEDLQVWQMEKTKATKKGPRKYAYWMASWREGGKTRNVHLGSCAKMGQGEALQKARDMKKEALG